MFFPSPAHLVPMMRIGRALLSPSWMLLAVIAASGCAQKAPSDLDDLAIFLWERFEAEDGLDRPAQETEIRDAVGELITVFAEIPVTEDSPFTGTIADLDEKHVAELEGIGKRGKDIALAQGFVLANLAPCSLEQEVAVVTNNRAMELHPELYESYEKEFDDDVEAFRSGDADVLSWTSSYKTQPLPVASAYTGRLRGGARRIDGGDGVGEILLVRAHLMEPAAFDEGDSEFALDFQLEIYADHGDGLLAHLYVVWRRMVLGLVDSSSEAFINPTLSGFVDYEKRVNEACIAGSL